MDIRVNDTLEMKKQHPCGSKSFLVLRSGMDFKLRCTGCGREKVCTAVRCKYINAMMTGDLLKAHPVICAFEHLVNNISRRIKIQE